MDADELTKAAAQKASLLLDVFFQTLTHASNKTKQEALMEIHRIHSEDLFAKKS
jgi:hypothetical protein